MNTLAEFQSYLSESFYRKIHLLEKIVGDRHWLTTGVFKEKILLNFLNETLPKKYKAQSGFVVFPCNKKFIQNKTPKNYDELNSSSYELSKQIDIIIYDQHNFSPIYSDNDIIICSPESVIGIVEVKGLLSSNHLNDAIKSLNDFTRKWMRYKKFREKRHVGSSLPKTSLYIYAWETKKRNNKPSLTGKSVRKILADNLKKMSTISNYENIPIISHAFIYNDYEVSFLFNIEDGKSSAGYYLFRGQYVVFDDQGNPKLGEDRTIYSLLRDILWCGSSLNNRFLIDSDEAAHEGLFPHKDMGYLKVYDLKG